VGVMNTNAASPKTALDEQAMQLDQSLQTGSRRTQSHARARRRVQHPSGHDDDNAGRHFDVNNLTVRSAFAVLASHAASVQRVPAVEDFDFLPDMGRMTLQSLLVGKTGYLSGPNSERGRLGSPRA